MRFVRAVREHLAETFDVALRRDSPENVSQILGAELLRRREVFEMGFDLGAPRFRFNRRIAFSVRQKYGTAEVDLRRPAPVLVIHRIYSAADHGYFVNRNGIGVRG